MSQTIQDLFDIDNATKPEEADREWRELHEYFDDRSRDATVKALNLLQMGIKSNQRPMELPAIRRLIKRLATVYKGPATRWLTRNGRKLSNRGAEHKLYSEIAKVARLNAKLRLADQLRTLFGQVLIRVYPSDNLGGLAIRVFPPYAVMRAPDDSDPDMISADKQFALRVGGDAFEHWRRTGDGWRMAMEDSKGTPLPFQPFEETGGVSPYAVLPALQMYAEDPNGRPWINPRSSRVAMQVALNAKANDLMALVRQEAHSDVFVVTERPSEVPQESGPGARIPLRPGSNVQTAAKAPKIAEAAGVITTFGKLWAMHEGLPSADYDDSKTILTGAALRVQEGELRELREEQIEFAIADESVLFDAMRAVWNVHHESWDREPLAEDLGLEVQISDVQTPQDPDKEQAFWHREIEMGLAHRIQWLMVRDQVDEDEGRRRFEHIDELKKAYPDEHPQEDAPSADDIPAPVGSPGGDREMDPETDALPPPNGVGLLG